MSGDLPDWRQPELICELATPIVVRRPDAAEPDYGCLNDVATAERIEAFRRHQVAMPAIGLSSTEIRRRTAAAESIRYQTPRAVEKYIETHGLYR